MAELAANYSAPFLPDVLARFVIRHTHPTLTTRQVEERASDLDLPFRSLPVFHHAKFWLGDTEHSRLMSSEMDPIYAAPAHVDRQGRTVPAEFDTVLVNSGAGEYIGVSGKSSYP